MTIKPTFVENTKVSQPFPPPTAKAAITANKFGVTEPLRPVQAAPTPKA